MATRLLLLTLLGPAAAAVAAQTPLSSVELIKPAPAKRFDADLPANAPRPVLYFLPRTSSPSCGLLLGASTTIMPMLEAQPGEPFPACEAVTEAAIFKLPAGNAYVFRYRQRDTREDVDAPYFFVVESGGGLQPLDLLNSETVPAKAQIRQVAAWAKSRLVGLDGEKNGYRVSGADSIVAANAFLSVGRNAALGSCRVVVDAVAEQAPVEATTSACGAILATSSLSKGPAVYFIVLTEAASNAVKGQIFVVDGTKVREATDLEQRLAAEIGSRKILRVKEALRKALASH